MQYIIETHSDIESLMRLFMTVDNSQLSVEFCIEKIRLSINNYSDFNTTITLLADLTLGVTADKDLTNRMMKHWIAIIMQILYYILHVDIQLPIHEIHLEHRDLRLITEG